MIRPHLLLALFVMLSSCTASYFVTVRKDGTAIVSFDRSYFSSSITHYYQSNAITKIDTSSHPFLVSIEVRSIDSLGYYLPFHPPGFFCFKLNDDTLTITNGYTGAYKNKEESCNAENLFITFEQGVDVISENGSVKKEGEHEILIVLTRRKLLKAKKNLKVVLELK